MRRRIGNHSFDASSSQTNKKKENIIDSTSFYTRERWLIRMTRRCPRHLRFFWKLCVFVFILWCSFSSIHQRNAYPHLLMPCPNTVIGIGSGYDLQTYQEFIGSLRSLGFQGNIILAVAKDSQPDVISYLLSQNVQIKDISTVKCSHQIFKYQENCIEGYDTIHISWVSYFLARSWIKENPFCSSKSVVIASIPHVKFVKDPFLNARSNWQGLHLFQMPSYETNNWRVAKPLHYCTGHTYSGVQFDDENDDDISTITPINFDWDVPLLSTSVVIGDIQSILFFLDSMITIMNEWSHLEKCPLHLHGTEMAVLNYLYYNGDIYTHVHPSFRKNDSVVHFVEHINDANESKIKYKGGLDAFPQTSSILVGYRRDPSSETDEFLHSMVTEHYSVQDYAELKDYVNKKR